MFPGFLRWFGRRWFDCASLLVLSWPVIAAPIARADFDEAYSYFRQSDEPRVALGRALDSIRWKVFHTDPDFQRLQLSQQSHFLKNVAGFCSRAGEDDIGETNRRVYREQAVHHWKQYLEWRLTLEESPTPPTETSDVQFQTKGAIGSLAQAIRRTKNAAAALEELREWPAAWFWATTEKLYRDYLQEVAQSEELTHAVIIPQLTDESRVHLYRHYLQVLRELKQRSPTLRSRYETIENEIVEAFSSANVTI